MGGWGWGGYDLGRGYTIEGTLENADFTFEKAANANEKTEKRKRARAGGGDICINTNW
jgi:hypothetical protein